MLLVPLMAIILGLALVAARDTPRRLRVKVRSHRMAQSLAASVRWRNVERACAALLSSSGPEPDLLQDRAALRLDLLRRIRELFMQLVGNVGHAVLQPI